jgi:hypothetical protein
VKGKNYRDLSVGNKEAKVYGSELSYEVQECLFHVSCYAILLKGHIFSICQLNSLKTTEGLINLTC